MTRQPGPAIPLEQQCLQAGAALIIFLLGAVALATLFLALGLSLSPVLSWLILIAAAGLAVAFAGLRANPAALIAIGLCVLALPLCHSIWDLSSDGQEYQFDAAYALAHGWNPFRRDFADFLPPGGTALPWPQHYPMAPWLIAALMWSAGADAETSKVALPILTIMVPLAVYPALRTAGLGTFAAWSIALLAAFNPVIATQIFTRYTDGIMAALATAFLGFGAVAILTRQRLAAASTLACLVLAIDTKFSALPIFAGLGAGLCAMAYADGGRKAAIPAMTTIGLATALTLITLGWHPYVSNTIAYGQPFYPIMGRDRIDIIAPFEPKGLSGRSAIVAMAKSLAAQTGSPSDDPIVRRKTPFAVSRAEWKVSGDVDLILGGFGPLFSGALLLGAVCAGLTLASRPRLRSAAALSLLLAAAAFGSAVLMPASWWARYVPQLWPGVLLLAAAALSARTRFSQPAGWLCLAVLAANAALVTSSTVALRRERMAVVARHIAAAKADPQGFCGAFATSHARIQLMRDAGVTVFPLPQKLPLTCKDAKVIPLAWDGLDNDAQSCPCSQIAHDPAGRWTAPPDHTRADYIELVKERQ